MNEVGRISEGVSAEHRTGAQESAVSDSSTIYRIRRVLAIRPFRRLWGVTGICSTGDWLQLIGLTALASSMATTYTAKNFAFSAVIFSSLLPGLVFAPIGGLLADRFDRRKIMVIADMLRCGLLVSIVVANSPWWLFTGTVLINVASSMWIPSKDAAMPNLLRRPDQVEQASQLGLFMTYGIAVPLGLGSFTIITSIEQFFQVKLFFLGVNTPIKLALLLAALLYLISASVIATRIPELSLRNVHALPREESKVLADADKESVSFWVMIKDGVKFVRSMPLVRGLLIGMVGAFTAGGAVVGSAQTYAKSLLGGQSSFALLIGAVFLGVVIGMIGAPKLAARLAHDRLFGVAIVFAGLALILVGFSPHLAVSLVFVAVVGACAGTAFLTGITIIGSQVEDSIRGRINALYQSLLKVVAGGSVALVPSLVGLVHPRTVNVWGNPIIIDGTRPVLIGGGLLAALVGVVAYRQMDSRRSEPILKDLRNAIRRRTKRTTGLLIAFEGTTATDTASQAERLVEWLGKGSREVVLAADPALHDAGLAGLFSGAPLTGARAQALAAAAVRADIVERDVQPALDAGRIVVMERFVDSPFAQLSAVAGLEPDELGGLADWATGRLRPDYTVLLDSSSDPMQKNSTQDSQRQAEQYLKMHYLLNEMASANPDRYIVVDADGSEDEIAARVQDALRRVLPIGSVSS
jgi:dTMP kinase